MKNHLEKHENTLHVLYPEQAGLTDAGYVYNIWVFYKINEEIWNDKVLKIIIKDRGKPTEEAKFPRDVPRELYTPPSSEFKNKVEIRLESAKSTDPNLEWAEITKVDEDKRIAFINGFYYESTKDAAVEKRYVIWEKPDQKLGFRELKPVNE